MKNVFCVLLAAVMAALLLGSCFHYDMHEADAASIVSSGEAR